MMKNLRFFLFLAPTLLGAQIDLTNQGLFNSVSTLPGTCQNGQLIFKTGVPNGQNVYACLNNNYVLQGTPGVTSFGPLGFPRSGNIITQQGDYNQMQVLGIINNVPFSVSPTFDLSKGDIQTITLTGTVTTPIFTNIQIGTVYKIMIFQDGVGNHNFQFPTNVKGGMLLTGLLPPSTYSSQLFVGTSNGLVAFAPGIINLQ